MVTPTFPGTANTSRFCSKAWEAVIREPLSVVASTITTPRERPLMILFLLGKFFPSGREERENSEITAPWLMMSEKSLLFSGG